MNSPEGFVVTGLGALCGTGLSSREAWKGLLSGESPIKPFSLFDSEGLSPDFGVELPTAAESLFVEQIKKRSRRQMTRATMIACVAAREAAKDARLEDPALDRSRIGVVIGATGTGYTPPPDKADEHRILRNMASSPAAWISLREKCFGPSQVVSTACSSGAYALHAACSLIASGSCDAVITGGVSSALNRPDVAGFAALMALAEHPDDLSRASCPFDARRSGFVMGEGGGMLVIESLSSAQKRGVPIRARCFLPGLNSEGYNILSPRPDGSGMAACMESALDNAGLAPHDIDYLNAHGTATPLNDAIETAAIKKVFGSHAPRLPVSSTKALTGHTLSAAAALEAVFCVQALAAQIIPPTRHRDHPDPDCDLDYVTEGPRSTTLHHVMSNSFAFGGQNGVCIFSRHDS